MDVIRPQPGETICDPASGTGGFLVAASMYVTGTTPTSTSTRNATSSFMRCAVSRSSTASPVFAR
ncbi:MAG TPA: N-6 DNA methylase [Planctomycetaceae bacterium]|nr:N-6 DNA methylase [Planctomycetaceae bacterium]